MAAVLACGEGAVLSHRSAAELFTLLPAAVPPAHVTVPFSRRPRHAGIAIHRSRTLNASAITARQRIPATRPWRTIEDIRRTESPRVVREAIRQADFHGFPLQNISTDRTRSELDFALPPALASAFGSVAIGCESAGVGGPPNGL